jgi:two-component system, NarL family, nitrate/nitrite response regulator NarL
MSPPPTGPIRVLVVDRHHIILWGVKQLIDANKPAMEVVGTAADWAGAIAAADETLPHVVVLDSQLLRGDGAGAIRSLTEAGNAKVLLFSGEQDDMLHETAILQGASGIVRKDETPPSVLLKAITKVHEGQLWLDRSTTGRIFVQLSRRKRDVAKDMARKKLETLTEREHDVVRTLVTQPGADNKRLARNLHIGEHTLRNHLSRIYDKLGVPNRVELYLFAQRHGGPGQASH